MSPDFNDSLPARVIPAEQRAKVVVPYTYTHHPVFPTPLYEYLYTKALNLHDAQVFRYQCFVMVLFPHPFVGFELSTGDTTRTLAVVLCEEVDGDEDTLLPAADMIAAGGKLTAVTGWLCSSHDEARTMWSDFVAPPELDEDDDESEYDEDPR